MKLVDLAEMTEGGSTFPLFFAVLGQLALASEDKTLQAFKVNKQEQYSFV